MRKNVLAVPVSLSLIGMVSVLLVISMFQPGTTSAASRDAEDAPLTVLSADNGYSFSNASVSLADGRDPASLVLTYEWAAQDFPGFRDCTFQLSDEEGKVLSLETHRFAGTAPGSSITIGVRNWAQADRVSAACGPRLDDAQGTYTFVDAKPVPISVPGTNELLIEYADAVWGGKSDVPGVAKCTFKAYEENDSLIFARKGLEFATEAASSGPTIISLESPEPLTSSPAAVAVQCLPFS